LLAWQLWLGLIKQSISNKPVKSVRMIPVTAPLPLFSVAVVLFPLFTHAIHIVHKCKHAGCSVQAFNWESCKGDFYQQLMGKVEQIKADGFTGVWLPPPSSAVSDQVRGMFLGHS